MLTKEQFSKIERDRLEQVKIEQPNLDYINEEFINDSIDECYEIHKRSWENLQKRWGISTIETSLKRMKEHYGIID